MISESAFQAKVVTYLKRKGCYVIKTQAGPGTPVGCPDVIALFPGWCALEIKKDAKARYQPLQRETIAKLDKMYYSRRVDPSNWDEVKDELEGML